MSTPNPVPPAGSTANPLPTPLATAWQQYGKWAAQASESQRSTRRWNRISLCLIVLAAFFGAVAALLAIEVKEPTGGFADFQPYLSLLAALATAVGSALGKELVVSRNEETWVAARRIAEAIKSECFRYAAASGDYAPANLAGRSAAAMLRDRVQQLTKDQANPLAQAGTLRPPPTMPMTHDAYVAERLQEQHGYYREEAARHDKAMRCVRYCAFIGALATTVLSVAASKWPMLTPIVAALTTAIGAVVAFGLLERHKAVASTYSMLRDSLEWAISAATQLPLADLVKETEDLLQTEHGAWVVHMRLAASHSAAQGGGAPPAPLAPPAPAPASAGAAAPEPTAASPDAAALAAAGRAGA
jgi:hypothetical protein